MSGVTNNPLRKYFREPGMAIQLPSGGHYYPKGMVETGIDGEVEVYPMTAYDELMLKNPDGLRSGDAVVKVIHSCVPGVVHPRGLCMADVNALMLAIRGASYGDDLSIDSACPACKHENSFGVSIRYLLDTATRFEPQYAVEIGEGVRVHMRPHSYETASRASIATFESIKMIQTLTEGEMDDREKERIFQEAFDRLCLSNLTTLAEAVAAVEVPEGMVTDRQHIHEFIRNIDARKAGLLQATLGEMNDKGVLKTYAVTCQKCEHTWDTTLSFDPSHFFA